MNKGFLIWLMATGLLVAGCARPTVVEQPPAGQPPVLSTETETEAPDLPLDQVAANLRHDAFDYYGLSNTRPIDLELVQDGAAPASGAQLRRLREVRDGEAIFEVQHTGQLESLLGSMQMALRPDGLYAIGSTLTKGTSNDLELPADLTPGKTWKMDQKVERVDGTTLHHTGTSRVVGLEKITTKAGSFEALRIDSTGSVNMRVAHDLTEVELQPMGKQGQEIPMNTRRWLSRGLGVVRMEIETTLDGKKTTVHVEAVANQAEGNAR